MRLLRKPITKTVSILLSLTMIISMFVVAPFESAAAEVLTWSGIQNEIDNAQAVTVKLTQHTTADDSDAYITVGNGKNVILDLNGLRSQEDAARPTTAAALSLSKAEGR